MVLPFENAASDVDNSTALTLRRDDDGSIIQLFPRVMNFRFIRHGICATIEYFARPSRSMGISERDAADVLGLSQARTQQKALRHRVRLEQAPAEVTLAPKRTPKGGRVLNCRRFRAPPRAVREASALACKVCRRARDCGTWSQGGASGHLRYIGRHRGNFRTVLIGRFRNATQGRAEEQS